MKMDKYLPFCPIDCDYRGKWQYRTDDSQAYPQDL
tara:strand:- start:32 stop:136 length:105 start_codon:yes stop_codon:yes gene_type:complete